MPPSFLQSAEWERFEASLDRTTRRVDNVLMARRSLPLGFHYWYCPRPLALTESFFGEAKKVANQERSVFLKIDPTEESATEVAHVAGKVARLAHAVQPRQSIVLDLIGHGEDELLAAMHEKTRYNIRLAERRGVRVENFQFSIFNSHSEKFETFWRLMEETTARDGFRAHPKEYYRKLLTIRTDDFSNELFFAEYRGVPVATAMVNFYRGLTSIETATYLHGASSRDRREVMAPHLLQWRVIQEAKKRGCVQYDFWGIDERLWPGVTRFKRGFGGREIAYPQSIDIVYRPIVYDAYRIAKKIIRPTA